MNYFKEYVSNTLAGSANQSMFESDGSLLCARVYYKLFTGGKNEYSLLFGDAMDSTFADGSLSKVNQVLGDWEIVSLKAGVVQCCDNQTALDPERFTEITFNRLPGKKVQKGEMFSTDPFLLNGRKDDYICLEMTFRGKKIPCHPELIIPAFRKEGETFVPSVNLPVPAMLGCRRQVEKRIGFLGDSITQGIGTEKNSYAHWNAVFAEQTGEENSYWNLGIGYARATDAATDGAWLYKAKQNEYVFLCLGVNDLMQGKSAEEITEALRIITQKLSEAGVKVIIQTVPPFDYDPGKTEKWNKVNDYIVSVLAPKAYGFFDNRPYLAESEENPHKAKYGGHPDAKGCAVWGNALYQYVKTELW